MTSGKEGFWGERTATIDWCESNYELSEYMAEFWNTVSNLVMIVLPLYSIAWSLRLRRRNARLRQEALRGQLIASQFELPRSVVLAQLGLLLVGVGSWMFHMTLLYPMQLLDELPMIYGSAILIFAQHDLILSVNEFEHGASKALRPVAALALALYSALVTFVYLSVWKNPLFHEAAYGLMVFVLVAQSLVLIRRLKSSKRIYLTSLAYYALGFTFWNLDNNICSTLKASRDWLDSTLGVSGAPGDLRSMLFNSGVILLKSLFEFHAWWHVFTGYASYVSILFAIDLNYQLHLERTKQPSSLRKYQQPVGHRFHRLYYYLTNQLTKDKA